MSEHIYTTEQVAKLVGMNRSSVYYYIRKGELTPLYKDQWQQDGTLLFSEEAVQTFLQTHKRSGLTTGEAAALLRITNAQVLQFIDKGLLQSTRVSLGKVEWNFIDKQEIERFQKECSHLIKKGFQNCTKDKCYYIFQLVEEPLSSQYARITSINANGMDGTVQFANGTTISIKEMRERGFIPAHPMANTGYSKKPGVLVFKAAIPEHIGDSLYKAIDFLYQYVGTKNVKVEWTDQYILIKVKPLFVELTNEMKEKFERVFMLLENSLQEGKITNRYNGWLFSNNLESMTLFLPAELKKEIQKKAEEKHMSANDWLVQFLQKHIEKEA